MKFAEVRECSKQKLLKEMEAENLDQAKKQVETTRPVVSFPHGKRCQKDTVIRRIRIRLR